MRPTTGQSSGGARPTGDAEARICRDIYRVRRRRGTGTGRAAIAASIAVLLASAALPFTLVAQKPEPEPDSVPFARRVGTMSDLMVQIIYPASDAIFYITTRTPTSSSEWTALEGTTLMLAESANLLMMPSRARGR